MLIRLACFCALALAATSQLRAADATPTPRAAKRHAAHAAKSKPTADATPSASAEKTSQSLAEITHPAGAPTSGTLNLVRLLADPLAPHPELRWLQERRAWAARHANGPAPLIQVAKEFEAKEAYYPALEMLWLADKMMAPTADRKALVAQMKELQEKKKPIEADVDAAVQMWGAGKPIEAIQQLQTIIKAHAYSELAYEKLGYLYLQSYRGEEAKSDKLIEPGPRARLFRLCYEAFACAIVIDPLLRDAYEYLHQTRELLPDQKAFLEKTNVLEQVSLNFNDALPSIDKLDNGKRDAKTLEDAGDGLLSVNQATYAVILFRAALQQPGLSAEDAAALTGKIDKTLERIPPDGGSPTKNPAPDNNAPPAGM